MSTVWSKRSVLQIDSWATGQQLVHANIIGNEITLEVTDGSYKWRGSLPVPWAIQPECQARKLTNEQRKELTEFVGWYRGNRGPEQLIALVESWLVTRSADPSRSSSDHRSANPVTES